MSQPRFLPGHDAPTRSRDTALLFAARGLDLLVAERDGALHIPTGAELPALATEAHFLGTLDGVDCYAAALPKDTEPPAGMKLVPARGLYNRVDEVLFAIAGRALATAEWDITHRFCGRDGQPTVLVPGERARRCSVCNTPFYPRISPAVIVLITRGDSMLLARNANFPGAFFSTLAGFVDVGESLEETVVREVKEEVGVELKNLRYFGSQPWPFGRSLMLGFTAEYAGGDIQVDGKEIAEAAWFTPDNLPNLPPPMSIARQLINSFIAQVKARSTRG
ncbi:NAD(+) diphosphatase [Archangium violaceum]|uniref:NAD(+) diphosphatase n=1 Tax=Archangium violaceum TaxID=83451 RepID=UPI00193B8E64|nr:NAD(+) diphosphatase [Archangium violaceum]QRK12007.1 NAD(+) diphosphatase [Archangium violaceum]